ncbi:MULTISPECIES: DUF6230 family protein [unclassified Streptomyces]|jgi:Family of unknown function (DUF6230)|uniref:DUF6230 family protein n=1 Tax=unclassified Streptomyces TaxID=2593676 RepID=UPI0004C7337B|nr:MULTISPECIES: DUF6230 family protein [unclassified Streptomyces]
MESQVRGGTRWKRFALVMVPSVALTAAVGVSLAQGALAASFSVSGQSFKVTAEHLDGKGFSQYGGIDAGYAELKGDKKTLHPVAISSFKSADITGMCQSVVTPDIPLLGSVSLQLKAGGGGTPVHAENLYLDVADLDADATFTNIDIGVAAKDATKGPKIKDGENVNENGFAQQADRAVLDNVKQKAWATTAGTFKLNGLSMRLYNGVKECY